MDELKAEKPASQKALLTYKSTLGVEKDKSSTIEDDMLELAERLSILGERFDQSSYEEKRRAVEGVVKDIQVSARIVEGKAIPVVTITFRFNEPCPTIPSPMPVVVPDRRPADTALRPPFPVSWKDPCYPELSYTKEWDLYDLIWYLSALDWSPPPNLPGLNQALQQTGWRDEPLTGKIWKAGLWIHIKTLDM